MKNKILYLGRIARVKDLETLDLALSSNLGADAIGPIEKGYNPKFRNITIKPQIYDLKKKIEVIDKYEIFVLPSKREAMPQALIEAMARGKIVISSDTCGGKELIKPLKNGFLFKIGNHLQLRLLIDVALGYKHKNIPIEEIKQEAIKTAKKFQLSKLIKKWEEII